MLKVGIPQIGMRAGSLYQRLEFDARQAALRNGAALWYAGGKNDLAGFVFQDSVGTTAATGTDPVGLLLDRSRVAGESYGADVTNFPVGWSVSGGGSISAGRANISGVSSVFKTVTTTANKIYRFTFSVTASANTLQVWLGGVQLWNSFAGGSGASSGSGVKTFLITAPATSLLELNGGDVSAVGYFENFSVQEAVGNLGPELNTAGASGWVVNSASQVVTGNSVAITNSVGTIYGYIYKSFPTVVGQRYKVTTTASNLTGSGPAYIFLGTFAGDSALGQTAVTSAKAYQIQFTATTTTSFVMLYVYGSDLSSTATYTDISVKQLLGYPALQATSGNRPTLELQANGYYGLRFDGSNDNFTEALTLNGTTPYTIIAAAKASNSAGTRSLVVGGLVAAGGNQRFPQLRVESGTGRIAAVFINDASVTQFVGNTTSVNGTSFVASITGAGAGQLSTLYLNGASNGTATAPVGPYTADTGLLGIYTGSLEGWDNPYFLICVAKTEFPAADRRAIERFAALLSGASYA